MRIHQSGGGIYFTVKETNKADYDVLLGKLKRTLNEMVRCGTTTVEIKTGAACIRLHLLSFSLRESLLLCLHSFALDALLNDLEPSCESKPPRPQSEAPKVNSMFQSTFLFLRLWTDLRKRAEAAANRQ